MRKIRFYATMMAVLLLGLGSCSNEHNAPESEENNVYLTVTSNDIRVNGANDNVWEGNEAIGLFSTELSATNKQFTNAEAGATSKFSPASDDDNILIPVGTATYTVSAYYPYSASATETAVEYDLNAVGTQPILHAVATGVSRTQPNAAFNFKHLLGKIIVNIKVEEGIEIGDDLSVTLNNAETKLTLNPVSGALVANTELSNLTLHRIGTTDSFYSFVMPKKGVIERTLTIINSGKSYTAKINHEIKAKVRRTFNVTLKAEGVNVGDGGSGIEEGEDGGSSEVPGEPETPATSTEITLGGDLVEEAGAKVMNATSDGGTKNLDVTVAKGQAFSVSTEAEWINLNIPTLRSSVSGVGPSSVGVVIAANETEEAREAVVTIASEGQESVTFTVKQAGKTTTPAEIVITPAETSINISAEGASASINVVVTPEGTEWKATSDQTWLTVTKEASAIKYTAEANTGAERTATITIKAGTKTATITVTQAKKVETPANNELYPNGFEGLVTVKKISGVTSSIESGKGKNGGDAISANGTCTKNNYAFEFKVPENMPKTPTKITFWIKGTATGKSMSIVNKNETGNGFNLDVIANEAVALDYGRVKYDGSIDATDWVQVTLDLTTAGDTFNNLETGAELFWFKIGKGGTYDILISDFEVF